MNIQKAHDFCASLPAATRDIKWGCDAVFSVGGRMFAVFTLDGDKLTDKVSFKVDDPRFLELTDRDGFIPAPYLARAKWVKLEGIRRLSDAEAKALLMDAHRLIAMKMPKKQQRELFGEVLG